MCSVGVAGWVRGRVPAGVGIERHHGEGGWLHGTASGQLHGAPCATAVHRGGASSWSWSWSCSEVRVGVRVIIIGGVTEGVL